MLESHRRLYNHMLAMRIASWECDRLLVGFRLQAWYFTALRKVNPFFARLNRGSAQATLQRLDRAYTRFFRRAQYSKSKKEGVPRFQSRNRFNSFEFLPYGNGCKLTDALLYIQYVGKIRVRLHRPYVGYIKAVKLLREGGKWFVALACDLGEVSAPKSNNPPIGVDMGLEHFATTSDGEHVPNPRFLELMLPQVRRLGRAISRKKKGGSNRRKAVKQLRAAHLKVRNQRHDFHHKTALNLTRRYGFIALESLTVENMVKNRRLAHAISDAGWAGFARILECKAESAGVEVVKVDPAWTSQLCSACGELVPKELGDRYHACKCGYEAHRDVNAARNILARGLAGAQPAGRNVKVASHVPRSQSYAAAV